MPRGIYYIDRCSCLCYSRLSPHPFMYYVMQAVSIYLFIHLSISLLCETFSPFKWLYIKLAQLRISFQSNMLHVDEFASLLDCTCPTILGGNFRAVFPSWKKCNFLHIKSLISVLHTLVIATDEHVDRHPLNCSYLKKRRNTIDYTYLFACVSHGTNMEYKIILHRANIPT